MFYIHIYTYIYTLHNTHITYTHSYIAVFYIDIVYIYTLHNTHIIYTHSYIAVFYIDKDKQSGSNSLVTIGSVQIANQHPHTLKICPGVYAIRVGGSNELGQGLLCNYGGRGCYVINWGVGLICNYGALL